MSISAHRIPIEGPLELGRTVRAMSVWGAAPWIRVDGDGSWFASRTDDGPGTVRMWTEGAALCAEGWGPGAERLLARVPRLAGLHDRPDLLEADHPVLADLLKHNPGFRIGAADEVFPTLVATILAQKVTGKESKASTRQMAWRWGEPAPGPREGLVLMPSPRQLREKSYAHFHPLGVERKRAMIVLEVARRARRLEACVGMSFPDAEARMQVLQGIGPWTTGVVLGQALGDPDAVPVGDYHLPNVVAWNLAGEPRADDARMLELLEPFAGQRGRVARLIKTRGTSPPKWGPRSDVRDFRGM